MQETASEETITHEWLKSMGFRWGEWDRSGGKHWILWFGNCREQRELSSAAEDIGIELAEPINLEQLGWSCWLRSDSSRKYGRFIHIRHVRTQQEVVEIIVALSAVPWKPENHLYMRNPLADRSRLSSANDHVGPKTPLPTRAYPTDNTDKYWADTLPVSLFVYGNRDGLR